jgi:amino acid transporter
MRDNTVLEKQLGWWDGLAIVLGIIVGAGIFALPGRVAQYSTGFTESALLWLIAGLFSLAGALVYAELGTKLPETGGEYVYLRQGFGALPAFLYGWSQLLVIRTAPGATQALVFAEYLERLIPIPGGEGSRLWVAAGLLWTLGLVNYAGLRAGRPVQWLTTTVKIGGILIILGAGLVGGLNPTNIASTHVPASADRLSNFAGAMLLVFFTYLGWDRLGNLAGEMKRPKHDIPRVLVVSVLAVIVLYISLALVMHSAIPVDQLAGSKTPASDAARLLIGPRGEALLAVIVLMATSSNINATILSSSRVYFTMSRDGGFLRGWLDRLHPRLLVPYIAVFAHVIWATCLLFAYRAVEGLISSQVFSMTIWYSLMAVGCLRLKSQRPWVAVVFLAGLVVLGGAIIATRPQTALANFALMASGAPVYWWLQRRNKASA